VDAIFRYKLMYRIRVHQTVGMEFDRIKPRGSFLMQILPESMARI